MKRIEDIKEFKDIDTYYEISKIVEEVFEDRVEAHKHLVTANKEIERLNKRIEDLNIINEEHKTLNGMIRKELQQKENIIKEVREYIENNDLYEQDYDYDYEENLVVGLPSDETARKILLGILDKGE